VRTLTRSYANRIPRVDHRLLLTAARPIAMTGIGHGAPGKRGKIGRRPQALVTDRVVPDLTGLLPSMTADRYRGEVERVVGDAGIDVHATIVPCGSQIVPHVGRLRILAEEVVVVRRAGCLYRAQCLPGEGQQTFPDQPISLIGRLLQR